MSERHLQINPLAVDALKAAKEVISGIPAKQIRLRTWAEKNRIDKLDKSIRCPGVWLATFLEAIPAPWIPETFLIQRKKNEEYEPAQAKDDGFIYGSLVFSEILGISPQASASLFRKPTWPEIEQEKSDKEIWLDRCDRLIHRLEHMVEG